MKSSGIVIISILAALIFSYFFFIKSGDEKADQEIETPSNVQSNEINNIKDILGSFYSKYQACMKEPPQQASGRVDEYCQLNTGLTSTNFKNNIEKGGIAKLGANPIFCAQSIPESTEAKDDFVITDNSASGTVNEKFGSANTPVVVKLVKEGSSWRLDNIVCPLQ